MYSLSIEKEVRILPKPAEGLFQAIFVSTKGSSFPDIVVNVWNPKDRSDLRGKINNEFNKYRNPHYGLHKIDWYGMSGHSYGACIWHRDDTVKYWGDGWNEDLVRKVFDE